MNLFEKKESDEEVGQAIIDYIILANLVREEESVLVWSANAAEQIGTFIRLRHKVFSR